MEIKKIINDPVHGFINITGDLVFQLVEHPWVQRLKRIRQLGLTDFVYPGATHSRFHHVIGALHLMQQAINVLRLKGNHITEKEEEAALIAILLHDVGHGPFSHCLEWSFFKQVSHEIVSKEIHKQLNDEFDNQLITAIQIFNGSYPKNFLNSLVSSQLDVDRLDYLTRDSFYSGVSEGVVNYDRIIKMLNVHEGELVVEEKGIYSIEKFIISRRIMYWQVYLHKTVFAAEEMLVQAIRRARSIIQSNKSSIECSGALRYFLTKQPTFMDNGFPSVALKQFMSLDDYDVFQALKNWQNYDDLVLSKLCSGLINRNLLKIKISNTPFDYAEIQLQKEKLKQKFDLSEEDASYLMLNGTIRNDAYSLDKNSIKILSKSGETKDLAEASDKLNIKALSEPVVKYYQTEYYV